MAKIKSIHGFHAGDIVKHEGRKIYIVSGVNGWIHHSWKNEDGTIDSHISLVRGLGKIDLLTNASRCKLVKRREDIKSNWWKIFPEQDK